MALQWQRIALPLNAGLQTRHDPRALEPPALTRCLNAEFTDLGGILKRKPYASIGTDIAGGGTLADIRRITTYRDELLAFTKDKLYSRSEADTAWHDRGTHLATKVTERSVFTRTNEQIDCDRAELDGVVLYAWAEKTATSTFRVLAAAIDSETGAVMAGPTVIDATASRPRVMALDSVFVLLLVNGTALETRVIDPTDLAGTIDDAAADTLTIDAVHTTRAEYDVARLGAKLVGVTSRHFDAFNDFVRTFSVDATGAITVSANNSRPSDSVVAIAARGDETTGNVLVVRIDGDAVEADLLDQDLADVSVNIALGNVQSSGSSLTANQITCAWRSVAESGTEFRCYAFWSGEEETDANGFEVRQNYADTNGNAGTASTLVHAQGVASHAFDHDGHVYVWTAFNGNQGDAGMAEPLGFRSELQNTYFLRRDDDTIAHAVSAPSVASGFAQTAGHLPGVQALGGNRYAWTGLERRVIPLGEEQTGYAARSPLDIVLELDSDDARRVVECGDTAYVAGGMVLQYDGEGLTELGYHVLPWSFGALDDSGGSMDVGTYVYRVAWAWPNAAGELDRSATGTTTSILLSGAANAVQLGTFTNRQTRKTDPRSEMAIEVWRTAHDSGVGAPFHLATGKDPSVTTGNNRYLTNDVDAANVTLVDGLGDGDLIRREAFPPAAVLENLAPPPASIIAADVERVFLAGIANRPNTIAYSKTREAGSVVSFNGFLTVDVPEQGGAITALAFLNETLVAFCETAVYALPGTGFDNTGGGSNYGPPRALALDVGAQSQDALAVTPMGIPFHGSKGWHLLDRGFNVRYIGAPVDRFDGDTFVSVHVLENAHQIRCLSTSRCLVYDTVAEQWSEWTLADAVGACIWQGVYHYATATDILAEQDDHTLADYSIDIETAWIKLAGRFQGYAKLRRVWLLGEFRSAHDVRIRVGKDYDEAAYIGDKAWTATPATAGGPLRFRYGVSQPKGSAFRVRITDQAVGEATAPSGEALRLTGLDLEIGIKRGGHKLGAGSKF
jgi:hypothetical protein